MPFCEIVGVTCTRKTFNTAMALMTHEDEDTYIWVLQQLSHLFGSKTPEVIVTDRELGLIKALGTVYPHVQHNLCHVHILRKCEEHAFEIYKDLAVQRRSKNECYGLFLSMSEESYEERRRGLWARWPALMPKIQRVWLTPYRRNIVRAWTNTIFHIGTWTTNR